MKHSKTFLILLGAGLLLSGPLQAAPPRMNPAWRVRRELRHELALEAKSSRETYRFTNIDVSGGFSPAIEKVNDRGLAVGNYCGDPDCFTIASFLWQDGRMTPLEYSGGPPSDWVYMYGIDDRDVVFGTVGWADRSSAAVFNPVNQRWSLLPDVSFRGTSYPFSQGYRRNLHGEAVGQSCRLDEAENWTCVGWLWTRAGYSFTSLPGTDTWFTGPLAINNRWDVVGQYLDETGHVHAYLQRGSQLTELEVPGAVDTYVNDINDSGEILLDGAFDDGSNVNNILKNGTLKALPNVPGAVNTYSYGLSNKGDYCGMWYDTDGAGHGFLAVRMAAGSPD